MVIKRTMQKVWLIKTVVTNIMCQNDFLVMILLKSQECTPEQYSTLVYCEKTFCEALVRWFTVMLPTNTHTRTSIPKDELVLFYWRWLVFNGCFFVLFVTDWCLMDGRRDCFDGGVTSTPRLSSWGESPPPLDCPPGWSPPPLDCPPGWSHLHH